MISDCMSLSNARLQPRRLILASAADGCKPMLGSRAKSNSAAEVLLNIIVPHEERLCDLTQRTRVRRTVDNKHLFSKSHLARIPNVKASTLLEIAWRVDADRSVKVFDRSGRARVHRVEVPRGLY